MDFFSKEDTRLEDFKTVKLNYQELKEVKGGCDDDDDEQTAVVLDNGCC